MKIIYQLKCKKMKLSDLENLDQQAINYWNDSYKLKKSDNLWGDDYVPFINDAINQFKRESGQYYLDLPCGDGRNLLPMCKHLPNVIGADTSKNSLTLSSERLISNNIKNSILLNTDIFQTCFVNNQFDGIFCWDVLGHLTNVEDALTELLRILKPKKKLVGSLFSHSDSTKGINMQNISQNEYIYENKFYFKFYDEDSVKSLLGKFNIKIINLQEVKWTEDPHEGYREYTHNHYSWAFIIEKRL